MGLAPEEVAVGGTRKVVDLNWLPRHQQIGITGRVVAPDLYVALASAATSTTPRASSARAPWSRRTPTPKPPSSEPPTSASWSTGTP